MKLKAMCKSISVSCNNDCDDMTGKYTGTESVTASGRQCQQWDTNYPHVIRSVQKQFIEKHNYCQSRILDGYNRGKDATPWCYTTDPSKRWENCNLPQCEQKSVSTILLEAACLSITTPPPSISNNFDICLAFQAGIHI